jgi:DNA invertase Pin-like site-specific DNA recombinase
MVFTGMAAWTQMELEIKRERITDSVAKRRAPAEDLGWRRPTFTDSQLRNALRLIMGGATGLAGGLGISEVTLCRGARDLPMPKRI